ncbi:MAG: hypothetical protein HQL69_22395 [Magnetococcales bacterium]|nr:hypothetical protein [Magnetococcales bacterium]
MCQIRLPRTATPTTPRQHQPELPIHQRELPVIEREHSLILAWSMGKAGPAGSQEGHLPSIFRYSGKPV